MKSYEVFTDRYSVIVQCNDVQSAAAIFSVQYSATDEIKQIVEVEYRDEQIKENAVCNCETPMHYFGTARLDRCVNCGKVAAKK